MTIPLGKSKPRNVNINNLNYVKPSQSSKEVDAPLLKCSMSVQSLNNLASPLADFVMTVKAVLGFLHISHKEAKRGSSVAIIYKSGFNVIMTKNKAVYTYFEHICYVNIGKMTICSKMGFKILYSSPNGRHINRIVFHNP